MHDYGSIYRGQCMYDWKDGAFISIKKYWRPVLEINLHVTPFAIASFPGHKRNGLATSSSSNCYFCCQNICIQFELMEVARPFLLQPGNGAIYFPWPELVLVASLFHLIAF